MMQEETRLICWFQETCYTFHISANGYSNVCNMTWDGKSYRSVVMGKTNRIGKFNHKTMQGAILECMDFCNVSEPFRTNLTIDLTRQFLNLGEHDAVGNLKKL